MAEWTFFPKYITLMIQPLGKGKEGSNVCTFYRDGDLFQFAIVQKPLHTDAKSMLVYIRNIAAKPPNT